ncbi:unnamed protein product [Pieris macdunnoughi]|uniref:Uncharacterized protein n=1 Tax=Pieris macdunnoughi TaxID=345717 RepID=A0A821SXT6_9NEOP|nr:unnamed protein product [Pieris macdunnoughi]
MVNDLPEVIRVARCLLFADDLKLLLSIQEVDDCKRLQENIDRSSIDIEQIRLVTDAGHIYHILDDEEKEYRIIDH